MVPFLKWAGGKRWLFTPEFVERLPKFKRYIEPFLGGGAGFFALEPNSAILSDINPELIELYEVVRDHPVGLKRQIAIHQTEHSECYYYAMRSEIPDTKVQRAARMLYLNRTCWNGLYRRNLKGEFNVPIGTKNAVILDTDNFKYASQLLSRASLRNVDFEETISSAGANDLLFVDPPYTVKHNMNGFVKYNEKIFSWEDQKRLKNSLIQASNRGAIVIVTNADHESLRELYSDCFHYVSISRMSVLSGKSSGRSLTTEAIFSSLAQLPSELGANPLQR